MSTRVIQIASFSLLIATVLFLVGCGPSTPDSKPVVTSPNGQSAMTSTPPKGSPAEEDHGHKAGAHGGIIVSLGRDSYHVEAIVTSAGEVRLYTLGNDESRLLEIPAQKISGFVKATEGADSVPVEFIPKPQEGDKEGKTSLLVAQLPETLVGKNIDVTVPNLTIEGERFRLGFSTKSESHGDDAMPVKIADEAEKALYLTPGGIYTQADVEANGNITASQKFASFQPKHDLKPKSGDKICPVTLTKANPKCAWIIGGKNYEFCCPPCVDEFVALAKTKPEEVKAPEHYVKGETTSDSEAK